MNTQQRLDLKVLRTKFSLVLDPVTNKSYWDLLRVWFTSSTLSKKELDERAKALLVTQENIALHNLFVKSIMHNAYFGYGPPGVFELISAPARPSSSSSSSNTATPSATNVPSNSNNPARTSSGSTNQQPRLMIPVQGSMKQLKLDPSKPSHLLQSNPRTSSGMAPPSSGAQPPFQPFHPPTTSTSHINIPPNLQNFVTTSASGHSATLSQQFIQHLTSQVHINPQAQSSQPQSSQQAQTTQTHIPHTQTAHPQASQPQTSSTAPSQPQAAPRPTETPQSFNPMKFQHLYRRRDTSFMGGVRLALNPRLIALRNRMHKYAASNGLFHVAPEVVEMMMEALEIYLQKIFVQVKPFAGPLPVACRLPWDLLEQETEEEIVEKKRKIEHDPKVITANTLYLGLLTRPSVLGEDLTVSLETVAYHCSK